MHADPIHTSLAAEEALRTASPATYPFPGRYLAAASLILAPLLILTGVLLRLRFDFFFPAQLAAAAEHPRLVFAAYACFLAGVILLWPGIVHLALRIGRTHPRWALWGGALVLFGLFARTFHAGIDHLAFQLVHAQGVDAAVETIQSTYGAPHLVKTLSAAIFFGWPVLAFGAYRSGTLGLVRSIALALMAGLMMGVLKGSSAISVVATAGLCISLMPLGVELLREEPSPSTGALLGWTVVAAAGVYAMYLLGQAG